ncbi:Hsp20/alpha crystallin family protein [Halobacillus salinarum]|uniref:Hsp20/alpha crystallin family protein n=1 Tax=Halobacillus salinarum TaxID=2932257 RepID=A0ABY4ESG7_9BACI|nr:Hsp20/alpha crystallin family protein [Halobacillus salinarum]UOQ45086.1 Hsp20/alpha crystallin family protein [Halobacillus salinarum]
MNPFQSMFPFGEDAQKWMKAAQSNDIHKFVNGVLENSMPAGFAHMGGLAAPATPREKNLNESVFDTHDHVYIKIPVHPSDSLEELKIYHKSYQLMIEGFPKPGDLHTITLPALVKKKGAVARYSDEELQIRLPKKVDTQYSEINVKRD